MVVDEQSRLALHRRLEDVLGVDAAATMMSFLPPVTWDQLVTKADLHALGERMDQRFVAVDQRFATLEERMDQRFAALEERMDQRFAVTDQCFAATDQRIESMGDRTLATLRSEMVAQTRTMVFATIGSMLTLSSLAFAAARLAA